MYRRLLWLYLLLCAGILGWLGTRIWWRIGRPRLEVTAAPDGEVPLPKDPQITFDPVVGHRPIRSSEFRFSMAPLGGRPRSILRRHNDLGLIDADDAADPDAKVRVLLVGDSHLMGVVDNPENAAEILERGLSDAGLDEPRVFNASCGYYSPYQYVLRARTLMERLRPQVVVLVVYLGNDFLELEDRGRPHLDDAGIEHPAAEPAPPDQDPERRQRLGLTAELEQLFWQGLNQARYFADHPERVGAVLARLERSLDLLREMCDAAGARPLVALLPSYDLVFPEKRTSWGTAASALAESNPNRSLYEGARQLLERRSLPWVDLLPSFATDHREELYATDFHIFVAGHALVAEELGPALQRELAR